MGVILLIRKRYTLLTGSKSLEASNLVVLVLKDFWNTTLLFLPNGGGDSTKTRKPFGLRQSLENITNRILGGLQFRIREKLLPFGRIFVKLQTLTLQLGILFRGVSELK